MLSAFYLQLQRRTWSFMVEKMFIEIRLCNLMTNVFKGHVKIVETYMVKINISLLSSLRRFNLTQDEESQKDPPFSFSHVNSTNVGMSPLSFLTFRFNRFATLV